MKEACYFRDTYASHILVSVYYNVSDGFALNMNSKTLTVGQTHKRNSYFGTFEQKYVRKHKIEVF